MSSIPRPHKKRITRRWWFWALVLIGGLILASIIATASGAFNKGTTDLDYLRETVTVEKRSFAKTITTTGTIVPDNSAALLVPAATTVTELPFTVGDDVNKDDVIVKTAAGVTLKAPFDGRVTAIHTVKDGQVAPQVPVAEISYRSNHIEFFASESEVIDLKAGQKVRFTIPSYQSGKDEYTGEVSFVDIKKQEALAAGGVAQESGYKVHVKMSDLPEALQKVIGLTVDMTIEVGSVNDVTSIEIGAIQYTEDNQSFVYLPPTIDESFASKVRAADDVAPLLQKKDITLGFRGDKYAEVKEGLSVGDAVLLFVPQAKTTSPF